MPSTLYPSLAEALELHRRLILRFGGSGGMRDQGLLESALHRPQSGYYRTVDEQAAALLQSVAQNHAFVDGNKRMAFALAAVFLRMNGYCLPVDPVEGERFMVDCVLAQRASLETITGWIAEHLQPAVAY